MVIAPKHIGAGLYKDQIDAHLLYFTIRLLSSSTCFKHYMLTIRRLNFIDATSGIVLCKKMNCLGLLEYN